MATTMFFRDSASDINPGAEMEKLMALERGASAVSKATSTVAGPVAPEDLYVTNGAGGTVIWWYSNPLDAVTISGNVTVNLRALESSTMANATVSMSCRRHDNAGATISTLFTGPTTNAELGAAEAAVNFVVTPTNTALSAGDRLVFYVYLDDGSGVTMASGHSVTFFYDGPTSGASGDSFVTFTETITEQGGGAPPLWLGQDRYTRMRYGRL